MKAILFDACDVLYHRPRYEQELDRYFGPERARISADKAAFLRKLQARAATGRISVENLFDGMLEIYSVPPDRYVKGRRFLTDAMADIDYFEDVPKTLHQLGADGVKLGVVTNSFQPSATKLAWFARAGIENVWDVFVSSSETGLLKPEPEIFLMALERLECRPDQAAYVAHAANELDGAKAVGMTTIAFNRDDDTVRADHVIAHFSALRGLARELRFSSAAAGGQPEG